MPPLSHNSTSDDRQRVLDATDIVDLIGDYVELKRAGREFVGLCPFHDDSKPSMYVVPNKQIFHCFVCGAGGNAFDFVMKYHAMGFREALELLAQRAGIELTKFTPKNKNNNHAPAQDNPHQHNVSREDLSRAVTFAQEFFKRTLAHTDNGKVARQAIQARSMSEQAVQDFAVGAAPDAWDGLANQITKQRLNPAPFLAAGLLKDRAERSSGGQGYYDTFRNRLIFPIIDLAGRPIAFGGRRLDEEDTPKYLNSPESMLFDKSSTLYGIKQAREAIRREGSCIVTEGYTDTIACHQAGIANVVATLGTALTPRHARMLKGMCDRVVLVFDGDEAGQRAAERAFTVFFAEPMDVRVLLLPDGMDPDEFLKDQGGPAQLQAHLDNAPPALQFFMERLQRSAQGKEGLARAAVVEQAAARLVEAGLNNLPPVRKRTVLRDLARIAGVSESDISAEIQRLNKKPRRTYTDNMGQGHTDHHEHDAAAAPIITGSPANLALGLALLDPALLARDAAATRVVADPLRYANAAVQRVALALGSLTTTNNQLEGVSPASLFPDDDQARAAASALTAWASRELGDAATPQNIASAWDDCAHRLMLHPNSPSPSQAHNQAHQGPDSAIDPKPTTTSGGTTNDPKALLRAALARRQGEQDKPKQSSVVRVPRPGAA